MDPQAEAEPEFSLVSTNNTEWASYAGAFWPHASPVFLSNLTTMDPQAESDPEFSLASTNNAEWASYAGAFRPQASGAFTRNIINHYHISGGVGGRGGDARGTGGGGGAGHGPTVYFGEPPQETLSPFRTIRLGDLNLIKEIRFDGQNCAGTAQKRNGGETPQYISRFGTRISCSSTA
ncbi:hypothetical protein MSAN_02274300 [Mycena sanguinolenta]|uniref:Uncharacterized protein n=1 Tax=Mycena sanguinolenta TaxID=230812 RepID=A0A8H6XB21_9AGAR|nr:hypothetical protein MSAN_02274300 [Mycena sanguinolenta]